MVEGLPFNFLAIFFLWETKVSHVLQTSYTSLYSHVQGWSSSKFKCFCFDLFCGIVCQHSKTHLPDKNVTNYVIFVVWNVEQRAQQWFKSIILCWSNSLTTAVKDLGHKRQFLANLEPLCSPTVNLAITRSPWSVG